MCAFFSVVYVPARHPPIFFPGSNLQSQTKVVGKVVQVTGSTFYLMFKKDGFPFC